MGQLRGRIEQDLVLKGFAPTTRQNSPAGAHV
jgi:hypothetical protein